jgi:hypothetical protein
LRVGRTQANKQTVDAMTAAAQALGSLGAHIEAAEFLNFDRARQIGGAILGCPTNHCPQETE